MARRPGDMGRNLARPNNPLGQLAPSFPTPAINRAHAAQPALLQANNELMPPPTVTPQTVQHGSFLFGRVPQAHGSSNPFQQLHSSGVVPPPPLHGNELAALVAGLNHVPPRPFQPNGHVIGWPLGQPYGPQQAQQQQPVPGPEPIGPIGRGVWGQQLPMPLPPAAAPGARFTRQLTGPVVPPYGSNAGAPPVGSNRYGAMSWAPRAARPAYLPAGNGRSPARTTGVLSEPTKSFEEFLRDQGIDIPLVPDELPVLNDTADACAAMVAELMGDPTEELGLVEKSVGLVISAGGNGQLPPAVGGAPTRDQLGLGTVRVSETSSSASGAVGGGRGYGRAAATAAIRKERSQKQAEKKVAAAAKARAERLAAVRGTRRATKDDWSRR